MKRIVCLLLALIPLCAFARTAAAAPVLSAHAAVLMESQSGDVLIDCRAQERLPMASTTKIMTALVALEEGDLCAIVHIPAEATGIEGSSVYLKPGEELTLEQLLLALMLESANDAAAAIAISVAGDIPTFAEKMNETARRLGLTNTHFTNPHGLDDEEHYTTAYDLALLTRYALENEDFRRIVSTRKATIPLCGAEGTRVLVNHNRLLRVYDGAIGVKTGYTRRCGRCLVSAAERDGVRMIAVTLNAPDDWRDHEAMLDYGFSQYTLCTLAEAGEIAVTIPCLGGVPSSVSASNAETASAVLRKTHGAVTVTVEADHHLCAPVAAGETVGTVHFSCDGREIARCALTARTSSDAIPPRRSLFDRLLQSFQGE